MGLNQGADRKTERERGIERKIKKQGIDRTTKFCQS